MRGNSTRVFVATKGVAHYRKAAEQPGCATRDPSRDALYKINIQKLGFDTWKRKENRYRYLRISIVETKKLYIVAWMMKGAKSKNAVLRYLSFKFWNCYKEAQREFVWGELEYNNNIIGQFLPGYHFCYISNFDHFYGSRIDLAPLRIQIFVKRKVLSPLLGIFIFL